MPSRKVLITGANGQLGRALGDIYPDAIKTDSSELDITNEEELASYDWGGVEIIINAAAYTNVDGAETPEGSKLAWEVNDKAVGNLCALAEKKNILLVHISTAYVFDGRKELYTESDRVDPLGVYAKTKAAGEKRVIRIPRHYLIRTDSVIGAGKNFVRTMLDLAKKGVSPTVVSDQFIRPTFTTELARSIKFLIDKQAPFGTYNITNEGDRISWADFTREIFKEARISLKVSNTTLSEYAASKPGIAPRPLNSLLDLTKIESLGFRPRDWRDDLREYIKKELK